MRKLKAAINSKCYYIYDKNYIYVSGSRKHAPDIRKLRRAIRKGFFKSVKIEYRSTENL